MEPSFRRYSSQICMSARAGACSSELSAAERSSPVERRRATERGGGGRRTLLWLVLLMGLVSRGHTAFVSATEPPSVRRPSIRRGVQQSDGPSSKPPSAASDRVGMTSSSASSAAASSWPSLNWTDIIRAERLSEPLFEPVPDSTLSMGIRTAGDPRRSLPLMMQLREHFPTSPIIVADTTSLEVPGPIQQWLRLSESSANDPVDFSYLLLRDEARNTGGESARPARGRRNTILDAVETPFIAFLDDDYQVTSHSRLDDLRRVLQTNPLLHVVGGRVEPPGRPNLVFRELDGVVYGLHGDRGRIVSAHAGGSNCLRCDVSPPFMVARVSAIQTIQWDETLGVGRDEDFFLRLRARFPGSVAFCPDVNISRKQELVPEPTGSPIVTGQQFTDALRVHDDFFLKHSLRKLQLRAAVYRTGTRSYEIHGTCSGDVDEANWTALHRKLEQQEESKTRLRLWRESRKEGPVIGESDSWSATGDEWGAAQVKDRMSLFDSLDAMP